MQSAPQHAQTPDIARWQVRLLGAVQARDGLHLLERFPSRAAAALLARLALQPGRDHPREELVELLWPGVALEVGRNRLRQALSSLKSLLEADGAAVIQADRLAVRAVPGMLDCDALQFERALRRGDAARAGALYRGELMPGFYDEWIVQERLRLQSLFERIADLPPTPAPAAALPAARAEPALEAPLPLYLTRLFGTEQAAVRLAEALREERLVTLLGPGGSGKTRLAVQVATQLRDGGGARPLFVPLVAATDAAGLRAGLARALRLGSGRDDLDTLAEVLAGRATLLVLDNFEQLVEAGAPLVAELLARLPALHVLVTSRRALGLDGEHCMPAEPLALPPPGAGLAAAASPAVALFVDRARAARADFHLHEGNAADVVRLVRALEGLPLAIELAASRVRAFAPAEMALRLAGGGALPLLARSGPRTGFDRRHASMEQVIDWSWRLLEPAAQQVLAALTVFEGDAAAEAVAAVSGHADAAIELDALVGHSLVRPLPVGDGSPRFGLYEPIREFVTAHVGAAALAALRARWRAWLLEWVAALGPMPLPRRVGVELAQIHAAIPSAVQDGDPAWAVAAALALRGYWDADGVPARCIAALEAALPSAGAQASALHELLAYLRFEGGDGTAALAHAQAALQAAQGEADHARALMRRVWVRVAADRTGEAAPDAAALFADIDEAIARARRAGDRDTEARALHQMAVMVCVEDPERGLELLAQSQALWMALGDRRKAFARLRNRAQLWSRLGRHDEAHASLLHCEAAAREDGDWVGLMDCQVSLSERARLQRDWPRVVQAASEAVALCWQRGHLHGLAYAMWNLPLPLAHLRRPEDAARLMAFASRLWVQRFGVLAAADRRDERLVRRLVRAQLGGPRTEALWIDGEALDLAGAVALACRA